MLFERTLQSLIESKLGQSKVIVIYGARQVGKTTLVQEIIQNYSGNADYYSCEEGYVREALSAETSVELKQFFGSPDLLVLDEAQKVLNIGTKLKLLVDNHPEMQILVTGSSSFELANRLKEPLTGRKFEYHLYPLSAQEISQKYKRHELQRLLERLLVFGSYPEVFNLSQKEAEIRLLELSSSYLFKDVFDFREIRNPETLHKLVRLLALQIGSEVSFGELANTLDITVETVERYIGLLEAAFVVFRLPAFSRNRRKEVGKSRKFYFVDLGIRNGLIKNFNPLDLRTDVGALWENFLVVERLKYLQTNQLFRNQYFWRTYQKQEIDYLEEYGGRLFAYEFKRNQSKLVRPPKTFMETYTEAVFETVNPKNWLDFVLEKDGG